MPRKYDYHTRAQLISLLENRDRERKLGLVWERDEIKVDGAPPLSWSSWRDIIYPVRGG